MKEPKKEDYGYCPNEGFDSEMGGFVVEGGEEAYYEALEKYKLYKESKLTTHEPVRKNKTNSQDKNIH